jgi:trehalose 6-phosphate synthase/phosphatase
MPSSSGGGPEGFLVLSNRLPYNLPKVGDTRPPKRNVGGLVNALEPVLARRGGGWVGWDGAVLPSAEAVQNASVRGRGFRTATGVDLHGVPLSERELARYYHGFANRTLWPLFHNFIEKTQFVKDDWETYVRVNRRFAETALARAGADGRVWVHDFHLMLVPAYLRQMGFRGRIDFFLHIPFPAPEIYRALPWREEVLRGLLAADSATFHVERYRDNFAAAARLAGARSLGSGPGDTVVLEHEGRRMAAAAAPIGIDVDDFDRIARLPEVEQRVRRIRASYGNRSILFGADRLDYTKGIRERLLAVERYLATHPGAAGSFVMVQVVVPSRHQVEEYRLMKREIDREVGRINGLYGREGWIPIHYGFRSLDRQELVAHYRAASTALVTPLRDGMNLVAPEYVASRIDDDGVLLLSEFAGVAERLPGALLVNPYDVEGCAAALGRAIGLGRDERAQRMRRLRESVHANPVSEWAARCLNLPTPRIEPAGAAVPRAAVRSLEPEAVES